MVFLVAVRPVVYKDGTWSEAFQEITLKSAVSERGSKTSDNEFANHALQIEANLTTGLYQYGTSHLLIPLNSIPRRFWPTKPWRGQGLFPEAMPQHFTAVEHNLGVGGASGIVADSFNNYGWFFPVFWFILGRLLASVYIRAIQQGSSLRWKLHYVGICFASHWLVAQNLAEAFVPATIYQVAFFLAFQLSTVQRVARSEARRANATSRSITLPKPHP
jgi:hypothetical protein